MLDVTGAPGVSDRLKQELSNIVGHTVSTVVRLVDLVDLLQVDGQCVLCGAVVNVVGLSGDGGKLVDGGHGAVLPVRLGKIWANLGSRFAGHRT